MTSVLAEKLLDWYGQFARKLPWRGQNNPYAIWISEVMLQQTRVDTVIPYYLRWMKRFPDLESLSQASEQEVLQVWEGLGYYSRARNLHRAACKISEQHGGQIPKDPAVLRKLPGFGPYMTAAVASIAFQWDLAALDANLYRVLSRVDDLEIPVKSARGQKRLQQLAAEHLPTGRAGDFNQALMDLGSELCTPRNPRCLLCPIREECKAFLLGVQGERPIKEPRQPVPHHVVTAALILRDGKFLIAQRPANGLLGGLWEFPGGKVKPGETLPECLQREIEEELGVVVETGRQLGVFQHAYTHFSITLHAFFCRLQEGEPKALEATELRWVLPDEMLHFPMGKIDRLIARQLQALSQTDA